MDIVPVAGLMMAPCTKAVWAELASLHGPAAGSVAVSWYGVASPCALSGFAGTISVQFALGAAASAAVLGGEHVSRANGRRDDGKAHDHGDYGQHGDRHGPEPGPAAAAGAGPAPAAAAAAARQEGGKPAGPGMRPAAAASLVAEIAASSPKSRSALSARPADVAWRPGWPYPPGRSYPPRLPVSASGAILTSLAVSWP